MKEINWGNLSKNSNKNNSSNNKFSAFYNIGRFSYIHGLIEKSDLFNYAGEELIRKTAVFVGKEKNIYIDTSDGVNDDLAMNEYAGRIKSVIKHCKGKPFVYFKAAYSNEKSENIVNLAKQNNGTVLPFFKWSFNENFYRSVYQKRDSIISNNAQTEKEYDIGYFCNLKDYYYPKPSESDNEISWSDHKAFNLPGESKDTGNYTLSSRKNLYEVINNSDFKVLHKGNLSYEDYIKESFKCKIILNPPGIGEYTSRLIDQCYLGNCIVMRKNSYDQGFTWKNHIRQVDFNSDDWVNDIKGIIKDRKSYGLLCKEYFDNFWSSQAIFDYILSNLK